MKTYVMLVIVYCNNSNYCKVNFHDSDTVRNCICKSYQYHSSGTVVTVTKCNFIIGQLRT